MKRLVIMASIAALLAAASPGHAQPGQGGGHRGGDRGARPMPPQRPEPPPQDFRNDRQAQDPRRGQLSPEERRQLRRDISDHGRDVYRDGQPKR